MADFFRAAKPVWAAGKELEKNYFLAFTASVPAGDGTLILTGSTAYNVYVNGEFRAYGPARAGKGWYRVDQLPVKLDRPENFVCIEVAGYNVNNFEYIDAPSFLQAELIVGGEIAAATGVGGFTAVHMAYKEQKVQRYSFQRPFVEYYHIGPDTLSYRTSVPAKGEELAEMPAVRLLPRGVLPLTFQRADVVERAEKGTVHPIPTPEKLWEDRALLNIGEELKGFPKSELTSILSQEMQELKFEASDTETVPFAPERLGPNEAAIYRFAHNTAGLLGVEIECEAPATVYLAFDEILLNGDIQFWRASCTSIVKYDLQPGRYNLLSFEPYVTHYVKVVVLGGACTINAVYNRQVVYPGPLALPETDNDNLRRVYKAAGETFRQNAVDIFMDCPSRERAGWLCDSFWTARVERLLTADSRIERNFLENFLLTEHYDFIPDGMFPMCWPSDHNDHKYIPNWAMWLVLQIEEYLGRTGDREMIDAFREKLYKLVRFFDQYTNSDGLLEKLDSWVFIEWSKSNDLVQDVNYPSNMLWARTLEAIGSLYGDRELTARAAAMKETIRRKSFNGEFFIDNAVRENGELVNGTIATESCQYYAFFTKTATPETYPELWKKLVEEFGPQRKETNAYPDVPFANAFIGNYLRLETLYREGLGDQVRREMEGYFVYMADRTGTLWELVSDVASCDHGFSSHVVCWAH